MIDMPSYISLPAQLLRSCLKPTGEKRGGERKRFSSQFVTVFLADPRNLNENDFEECLKSIKIATQTHVGLFLFHCLIQILWVKILVTESVGVPQGSVLGFHNIGTKRHASIQWDILNTITDLLRFLVVL